MFELPSLQPIPDDIFSTIEELIHRHPRPEGLETWLKTLIRTSGHLSNSEDLRWRLVCMVWLAFEYDLDSAWDYLMWFNQSQETLSEHVSDMLYEGINDLVAHVQLSEWLTQTDQPRLKNLFVDYRNLPSLTVVPRLMRRLLARPTDPAVGRWLKQYCHDMDGNMSQYNRPWRLLIATWYATCFDGLDGLHYLHRLTNQANKLSQADLKQLTDTANELNATPALIQWIADCPDDSVKAFLADFGHPNLGIYIETKFQQPPDFQHLSQSASQAPRDGASFKRHLTWLQKSGMSQRAAILDLGCGPLAPQTVLLSSVGYQVTGADLNIPPAYWPVNIIQRLTRGKHVKAWQTATDAYYQALARETGVSLNWKKANIELVDLTRLKFDTSSFDAVVCSQYIHHAPDVCGLLGEAARVLKPNGLLLVDLRPYPTLSGAFQPAEAEPAWGHLRQLEIGAPAGVVLNQWREAQYRTALSQFFTIEQWLTEIDPLAEQKLTPAIQAELSDYTVEELTRLEVMVVARKM